MSAAHAFTELYGDQREVRLSCPPTDGDGRGAIEETAVPCWLSSLAADDVLPE
jgi:hypothetical protein